MASTTSAWARRFSSTEYTPGAGAEPPILASHKLDRLRELRAVIDALRQEREERDPVYAWLGERERAESRQRG